MSVIVSTSNNGFRKDVSIKESNRSFIIGINVEISSFCVMKEIIDLAI